MSEPVDLAYVCGNRFLAINSTPSVVHVTYRVVGTREAGGLTLPAGLAEDEGFSESELETKARGSVELFLDGERIALRQNRGTSCGPSSMASSVAGAASAEGGSWSAPFPTPEVLVHLSLLPTGKVLAWGEFKPPQIWDPATGSYTPVPSPINVFCSGHTFLGDGRLLVAGGHLGRDRGFPDISIFDPFTESWSRAPPMPRGRWYATSTTLGDGDVLIIGGRDELSEWVREPELWTPGGQRSLSGAGRGLPYYPRTFLMPDGRIFYAGSQLGSKFLDPSGTGHWTLGPQQLYPSARSYGAAVVYDEGKILYAGGGLTTNTAEIIDLNFAAPAWQWTGSMAYPRRHLNANVLPTGEVLVTGGSAGTTFNDFEQAVHAAELWSPLTGTWRTLAGNSVRRAYHSTSLLLPDGRVLHAGSGNGGGGPNEETAEIFSPPYLFQGSRPTIDAAPSKVAYGSRFTLATPQAASIDKVSLIRLGSTTHAFDMNQRFQWLSFTRGAGDLSISAPASRNVTPPGHYMLFILDDGVPSVAKIVRVGSTSESGPPANQAPAASFSAECVDLSCRFTDTSTDADGTVAGWSWDFGDDAGTSSDQNPSYTYGAEGSYDISLTATDDDGATGTVSHQVTVAPPGPNQPPSAGFTSSCTHLTCTFSDASTDPDGTITGWSWSFGDGEMATDRNPSHAYVAAGSYDVVLTVSDDAGGTNQASAKVTITAPPAITLTATGWADAGRQYMRLEWSGATGTTVDIYRNGSLLRNTLNDGRDTNGRKVTGAAIYVFKVCEAGTVLCSSEVTVRFEATPAIILSATGWVDGTRQRMRLEWSGASGTTVDIYRNSRLLRNTSNDGRDTNSRNFTGAATYVFKVCETGTTNCSNEATVQFDGSPNPITLSATGWVADGRQYMRLEWGGATGTTVDIYRNASFLRNTANDGRDTNGRKFTGAATYVFKVCQAGSAVCSNEVVVEFR